MLSFEAQKAARTAALQTVYEFATAKLAHITAAATEAGLSDVWTCEQQLNRFSDLDTLVIRRTGQVEGEQIEGVAHIFGSLYAGGVRVRVSCGCAKVIYPPRKSGTHNVEAILKSALNYVDDQFSRVRARLEQNIARAASITALRTEFAEQLVLVHDAIGVEADTKDTALVQVRFYQRIPFTRLSEVLRLLDEALRAVDPIEDEASLTSHNLRRFARYLRTTDEEENENE